MRGVSSAEERLETGVRRWTTVGVRKAAYRAGRTRAASGRERPTSPRAFWRCFAGSGTSLSHSDSAWRGWRRGMQKAT